MFVCEKAVNFYFFLQQTRFFSAGMVESLIKKKTLCYCVHLFVL